jgi:protein-disulfide isomerase
VALGFSLYSIVLGMISTWLIQSFCILCIVLYGINFLLLYFTWLSRKRFDSDLYGRALKKDIQFLSEKRKPVAIALVPFLAAVILIWTFFPVYWYFEPPPIRADLPHGITADGHPWIGAEDAGLVITEYADYLCFQCNKMHYYLRNLINRYPGKLKIVHRHFPMDPQVNPLLTKKVHEGAGTLAIFALYAASQGKFWQMNDHLFATARTAGSIDVTALANTVGLDPEGLQRSLKDPVLWQKLRSDLTDGFKLGVSGTPTFVVNGRLYEGQLPPKVFSQIVD